MSNRVNINDVAKVSGVSIQTVSRVLNARPDVAPATRARIERAIDDLGFVPNTTARSLAKSTSATLGVITNRIDTTGASQLINAISVECRQLNLSLMIGTGVTARGEGLANALREMRRHNVDGVVVLLPGLEAEQVIAPRTHSWAPPVAYVRSEVPRTASSVTVADEAGARLVTEHLLSQGRRRIAHIAGPTAFDSEAMARMKGWRRAIVAAGEAPIPAFVGDWSAASAASGFAGMWNLYRPDAVFAANDHMALAVLHECAQMGLETPGDVAVVGFDDIVEAAYANPSLTTVRQPFAALARRAVEFALDTDSIRSEVVPVSLVVRDSTGSATRAPLRTVS